MTGRCARFSLGTPVSSTNKTDRHDINEILLKVALNTIKQTNEQSKNIWTKAIRLRIYFRSLFKDLFCNISQCLKKVLITGPIWKMLCNNLKNINNNLFGRLISIFLYVFLFFTIFHKCYFSPKITKCTYMTFYNKLSDTDTG